MRFLLKHQAPSLFAELNLLFDEAISQFHSRGYLMYEMQRQKV